MLTGKVAIANAKLAYQRHRELLSGRRWQVAASPGAQTTRLLPASTGTKNPDDHDVAYIEKADRTRDRQHDRSCDLF